MSRPRIGVTVSTRSGWRIFPLMWLSVWLGGGRAVKWTTRKEADLNTVDGLIVGGGDDISAELYGGNLLVKSRIDPDRDALEIRLVCEAFEQGKPVLGICRGAQMINVALGGTLHQDAYGAHDAGRRMWTVLPRKRIRIVEGSWLATYAGTEEMRVNALHSQSVAELGQGLRVVALDGFGIVQAIERADDPFVLGVQWHPEHLFYARRQRALFAAVVRAAAQIRKGAGTTPAAHPAQ